MGLRQSRQGRRASALRRVAARSDERTGERLQNALVQEGFLLLHYLLENCAGVGGCAGPSAQFDGCHTTNLLWSLLVQMDRANTKAAGLADFGGVASSIAICVSRLTDQLAAVARKQDEKAGGTQGS